MTKHTDREFLERAAKAAKLNVVDADDAGLRISSDACCTGYRWNPLTDDGDALRLACALRINIEHAETLSRKASGVNCWPVGRGDCGHMETVLTDYNAATRRAITCAAAEIGKAMP